MISSQRKLSMIDKQCIGHTKPFKYCALHDKRQQADKEKNEKDECKAEGYPSSWCSFLFLKPIYFLSNDRMIPITALEEKNMASKRPVDNNPVLGLSKMSDMKFYQSRVIFFTGYYIFYQQKHLVDKIL